jgi:hypothetical protein
LQDFSVDPTLAQRVDDTELLFLFIAQLNVRSEIGPFVQVVAVRVPVANRRRGYDHWIVLLNRLERRSTWVVEGVLLGILVGRFIVVLGRSLLERSSIVGLLLLDF